MAGLLLLDEALERVREHLIDWSAPDPTGRLATQLTELAIARLHYAEEHFGLAPSACAIVGPDSSPSRNPDRLSAGYSTGGEVWWSEGRPFLPLGMLPTCCGITVAEVELHDTPANYGLRLLRLHRMGLAHDGLPLQIDLNRKNHFVGLFERGDGQTLAVVHCSAPELRHESFEGFGMSWVECKRLRALTNLLDTPAGSLPILTGEGSIAAFLRLTRYAQAFAERKRELIVKELFGETSTILSSRQHQGYVNDRHVVLGSQLADDRSDDYIYLLGPDRASYLVRRLSADDLISPPTSAPREGLALVPHGGGSEIVDIDAAKVITGPDDMLHFQLSGSDGYEFHLGGLADLPFGYRGEENLTWAEHLGICLKAEQLRPVATLRN